MTQLNKRVQANVNKNVASQAELVMDDIKLHKALESIPTKKIRSKSDLKFFLMKSNRIYTAYVAWEKKTCPSSRG